jgi:uncharacterized protein with LGFP repeats
MLTLASVTDRLASRLDRDGDSRRGFLAKAAVVGAALATNPLQWILKPGTAYANVCGDGVGCGTGWTVFCCTVNNGANTCPEGSFAAGWWKADSSAFCGGAARYYIDCNRLPSRPGSCSCISCHGGNGTCDQRRYCCNVFRYGQCHLEIAGVTPVVCRVITCTPPWQWDPACSASPRTDNRTGRHTAPCLPGPGASAITLKLQDLGMAGSPLGRQLTPEEDAPGGGRRVTFERGQIHWRADLGAFGSWGPVHQAWVDSFGGPAGRAGYPRSDTRPGPNGGSSQMFEHMALFSSQATGTQPVWGAILEAYGRVGGPAAVGYPLAPEEAAPQGGRQVRFENGTITWRSDLGARAVLGEIHATWTRLGGPAGFVGLPWSDQLRVGGGRGAVQWFTGAAIYSAPGAGTHEVHEPVLGGYQAVRGPDGAIGFPVSDVEQLPGGGSWCRFERGAVTSRPDVGTHAVYGAMHERWTALGGPTGTLGLPWTNELGVGDRRGRVQWFSGGGAVFWSSATGAFDVREPILAAYRARGGGPAGPLGYPVAAPEQLPDGGSRQRFERGTLVADSAGNVTQQ